jgi:hypothetical protein
MDGKLKFGAFLPFDGQVLSKELHDRLELIYYRYFFLHVLYFVILSLDCYLLFLELLHLGLETHYNLLELVSLSSNAL